MGIGCVKGPRNESTPRDRIEWAPRYEEPSAAVAFDDEWRYAVDEKGETPTCATSCSQLATMITWLR